MWEPMRVRRRGISVEIVDALAGIFKLRHVGHEMLCRESLTELTGGVAMTWCQDKVLTLRRLASVGPRCFPCWARSCWVLLRLSAGARSRWRRP